MRLRTAIIALLLLLPGKLFAAEACVVLSNDLAPYREALIGFQETFKGKAHTFSLEGSVEKSGVLVNDLHATQCDVYVGFGSLAFDFLMLRTKDKPIVYALVLNVIPQRSGKRPIAGVRLEPNPEFVLHAINEVLPSAQRIGILYTPSLTKHYVEAAQRAARQSGKQLVPIAVTSIGEAIRSAKTLAGSADVVWMIADAVTSSKLVFEQLLVLSFQHGIPIFGLSPRNVRHSALLSLEVPYREHGAAAAQIAKRLAAGDRRNVGEHSVVPPKGYVINTKTARKLKLVIPE